MQYRKDLTQDIQGNYAVHYFTYANQMKDQLKQLLFTAAIHGINITVEVRYYYSNEKVLILLVGLGPG